MIRRKVLRVKVGLLHCFGPVVEGRRGKAEWSSCKKRRHFVHGMAGTHRHRSADYDSFLLLILLGFLMGQEKKEWDCVLMRREKKEKRW